VDGGAGVALSVADRRSIGGVVGGVALLPTLSPAPHPFNRREMIGGRVIGGRSVVVVVAAAAAVAEARTERGLLLLVWSSSSREDRDSGAALLLQQERLP
jgi:hypothetical protein